MSPADGPRPLTLADAMVLVALTAVGLTCYVLVDDALFHGQRYVFGLFEGWPAAWDAAHLANRAAGLFGVLLPLFGGWTFAVPLLWLRGPRAGRRGLGRYPGVVACAAALAGAAFSVSAAVAAFLLRFWGEGRARWPWDFDGLIVSAGGAVAAVAAVWVVSGRRRPSPDWLDRLGRAVGGLWVAAAFVFAVRAALG